jgi:hypothetical protein
MGTTPPGTPVIEKAERKETSPARNQPSRELDAIRQAASPSSSQGPEMVKTPEQQGTEKSATLPQAEGQESTSSDLRPGTQKPSELDAIRQVASPSGSQGPEMVKTPERQETTPKKEGAVDAGGTIPQLRLDTSKLGGVSDSQQPSPTALRRSRAPSAASTLSRLVHLSSQERRRSPSIVGKGEDSSGKNTPKVHPRDISDLPRVEGMTLLPPDAERRSSSPGRGSDLGRKSPRIGSEYDYPGYEYISGGEESPRVSEVPWSESSESGDSLMSLERPRLAESQARDQAIEHQHLWESILLSYYAEHGDNPVKDKVNAFFNSNDARDIEKVKGIKLTEEEIKVTIGVYRSLQERFEAMERKSATAPSDLDRNAEIPDEFLGRGLCEMRPLIRQLERVQRWALQNDRRKLSERLGQYKDFVKSCVEIGEGSFSALLNLKLDVINKAEILHEFVSRSEVLISGIQEHNRAMSMGKDAFTTGHSTTLGFFGFQLQGEANPRGLLQNFSADLAPYFRRQSNVQAYFEKKGKLNAKLEKERAAREREAENSKGKGVEEPAGESSRQAIEVIDVYPLQFAPAKSGPLARFEDFLRRDLPAGRDLESAHASLWKSLDINNISEGTDAGMQTILKETHGAIDTFATEALERIVRKQTSNLPTKEHRKQYERLKSHLRDLQKYADEMEAVVKNEGSGELPKLPYSSERLDYYREKYVTPLRENAQSVNLLVSDEMNRELERIRILYDTDSLLIKAANYEEIRAHYVSMGNILQNVGRTFASTFLGRALSAAPNPK